MKYKKLSTLILSGILLCSCSTSSISSSIISKESSSNETSTSQSEESIATTTEITIEITTTSEETTTTTEEPKEIEPTSVETEPPTETTIKETTEATTKTTTSSTTVKETTEKPTTTTTGTPTTTTEAPTTTKTAEPTTTTTEAPTTTTAEPSETKPKSLGDNSGSFNSDMAKEVLTLVNQKRQENGLAPLSWNKTLAKAADIRATEIVVSFSHTRPDGSEWWSAGAQTQMGENLAFGQTSATEVVEAWMKSSTHRDNILSGSYSVLGVSCYYCNGVYYWAQEFA